MSRKHILHHATSVDREQRAPAEDAGQAPERGERERSGSLVRIVLESEPRGPLAPLMEADREQAIADLERENEFVLEGARSGPYVLHLSIRDRRLVLDVRDPTSCPIVAHVLALGPFRHLIKDYQLMLESYAKAVEEGHADKLEAIDMGRRGLHDEAAGLMRERLAGKVTMNLATARRLFTLIALLHQRF